MKKIFTFFAAMALVAGVSAQVDLSIDGFVDGLETQQPITTLNLSETDDLNPICVLSMNSGTLQNADSVFFDVSIDGMPRGSMFNLGSQLIGAGLSTETGLLIYGQAPLVPAADLAQIVNTLGKNSFELCYAVRVVGSTDTDNSNDKACVNVVIGGNGIEGFNAESINVYPNPANNVINVANAENAQVSVFDVNGRMMFNTENASANQTIDATNFANGLYIVRIVENGNVMTKKINVVK